MNNEEKLVGSIHDVIALHTPEALMLTQEQEVLIDELVKSLAKSLKEFKDSL
jgi:hypothetical protein